MSETSAPLVDSILARAWQRATALALPYRGALTPADAFALWHAVGGAQLIDVRTRAELDWVGRVPGALHIEWNSYPGGVRNARFAEELERAVDKHAGAVLFLCRSGNRSHHAAAVAAQLGYADAYNVLEGFEGDKDAHGHRNTLNGWRVAGLPWTQG
ncbi:MAG: rhodanese-like domain-containing protein [Burkholderiales bacterium]|nr:rhodanese-like domain-containing protein [Burkholderiales bacterium]